MTKLVFIKAFHAYKLAFLTPGMLLNLFCDVNMVITNVIYLSSKNI